MGRTRSCDARSDVARNETKEGLLHMENRIDKECQLHDDAGKLACKGYAFEPLVHYDRARVAASPMRIKEWDYYCINDDEYAVALTIGDMGYSGLLSASVIRLADPVGSVTQSVITPFPLGHFSMPPTSDEGVSSFSNKRVSFDFSVADGVRSIEVRFDQFHGDDQLDVHIFLDEQPRDSMVIVTPWAEDEKAFYYNRKIVGMRAMGTLDVGKEHHVFDGKRSFGLLDWGRGVWTRDNTWYWAFAQGWQDGRGGNDTGTCRFGLNLGYGFGDTSAASENMAFLDGRGFKLGRVRFEIEPAIGGEVCAATTSGVAAPDLGVAVPLPKAAGIAKGKQIAERFNMMRPWRMVDDEGDVDLVFTPIHDRCDYMNAAGLIVSDQHQLFGTYDGTVKLDGRAFTVAGLLGAAEVVHNRY